MSYACHERLCKLNPNRLLITFNNPEFREKTQLKASNQFIKAKELGMPTPEISEKVKNGHPHTKETKLKLSIIAKDKNLGGYQERAGRSKKFYVFDSFNKRVCLQSSYELICSNILNDLKIKWIRPKALKYDNKNYYADFYLVDYNIYLDPKNNFKAKCDEIKINNVIKQNNVKVFILLKSQLSKEFILNLIK